MKPIQLVSVFVLIGCFVGVSPAQEPPKGSTYAGDVVVDSVKLPLYKSVPAKKRVSPQYPYEDWKEKTEGSLIVGAVVAEDGRVSGTFIAEAKATKGMQRAALEAVRKWIFPSISKDGKRIKYVTLQPMSFSFKE